jgi:hypothetical protein
MGGVRCRGPLAAISDLRHLSPLPAQSADGSLMGRLPTLWVAHEPRLALLALVAGGSPERHSARLVVGDDRSQPDRPSLA